MTEQVQPEGGSTPETGANVIQSVETTTEVVAQPNGNGAESPPAAKDPGETKEPKGFMKRIDELTRNWREEQRKNERLLALLERGQAPQSVQEPAKPKSLADFGYDETKYREYLFTEARAEAARAAKEEAANWRKELEGQTRRQAFDARVEKFAAETEDFHAVFTPETPVSEAMAEAMMDSEEGPAIAYYLGKNPEIAQKLYQLSPALAGREIARIEDRIVAERKKAAEKPVSQAPPPPPKIDGTDPGNVEKDPSKMTDAEFAKWRRKQIAQRR